MKLLATKEKVAIKWFAVLHDGSQVRNNKGFIHNAWDVTCSCGWKTSTGGALRSHIEEEVWNHKFHEHNYRTFDSIKASESVEIKDLDEIVFTRNGIIVGKVQIMITDRPSDTEFVGHSVNYGHAIQGTSLFHLDTDNKFWSGESIQIKTGA